MPPRRSSRVYVHLPCEIAPLSLFCGLGFNLKFVYLLCKPPGPVRDKNLLSCLNVFSGAYLYCHVKTLTFQEPDPYLDAGFATQSASDVARVVGCARHSSASCIHQHCQVGSAWQIESELLTPVPGQGVLPWCLVHEVASAYGHNCICNMS
jgi:hypothetical protein